MDGEASTNLGLLAEGHIRKASLVAKKRGGLTTHWQPAIQEEIGAAMEGPGQSGSSRLPELHKWVHVAFQGGFLGP